MAGQPACAPLPRSVECQFIEFYLNRFTGQFRHFSIGRKKGHLPASVFPTLKHIDGFAPGGMLVVVYFAEIEDLPLNNTVVRHTVVFNDAPVAMFFTVFKSFFGSQKHAPIFRGQNGKIKGVGRHYKRF